MPTKLERPHRAALTRMFRATGAVHVAEIAPLVELLRTLADEMDAHGGARTRATYMSALREFRRVDLPAVEAKDSSPVVVDAPTVGAAVNNLQLFKEQRGLA